MQTNSRCGCKPLAFCDQGVVEIARDHRPQQLAGAAQQRVAPVAAEIGAVGDDGHRMAVAAERARESVGIRPLPEVADHQDAQRTFGGGHRRAIPRRRGARSPCRNDAMANDGRGAPMSPNARKCAWRCQIAAYSSTFFNIPPTAVAGNLRPAMPRDGAGGWRSLPIRMISQRLDRRGGGRRRRPAEIWHGGCGGRRIGALAAGSGAD